MSGTDHTSGLVRRVAFVSGAVVVLLAATFGITIWENSTAHARAHHERAARIEKLQASLAGTAFWRERESMNEYLLGRNPELVGELRKDAASFTGATNGLGTDNTQEASLVAQTRAANDSFLAAFDRVRADPGGNAAAGLSELNTGEAAVLAPLGALQSIYTHEVASDMRAAGSAYSRSLLAGIIGAILAVGAGIRLRRLRAPADRPGSASARPG